MLKDAVYGLRNLFRNPGFALVAILTLGIGIGANATMFSAVNATLLRPMPVPEPERIVRVYNQIRGRDNYFEISYPDYLDLKERSQTLSGIAGHKLISVAYAQGGENELVWGELVTGNYFDVLEVKPVLGRGFLPDEDRTEGTHPVVVVSHTFWRERLGGNPQAVGSTLRVNGREFTVVGVAPKGFGGTKFALALDMWFPMMMHDQVRTYATGTGVLQERGSCWLETFARLAPGVTVEQARSEVAAIAANLEAENPDSNARQTMTLFYEPEVRIGDNPNSAASTAAGLILTVVGIVLLIACANVSSLLLARASTRQREIGVRVALGAGRGRLVRQLLTESLLLALFGGAVGLIIAYWASGLLMALAPATPISVGLDVTPDWMVLGYSALATMVATVVFGLVPALQTSRVDVVTALKADSAGTGQHLGGRRLRNALVVAQIAMSVVLLAGAGLFLRGFGAAQSTDLGFDGRSLLFASVDPGLMAYAPEQGRAFFEQLLERVRALPGVRSASVADVLPLGDTHNSTGPFVPEGYDISDPSRRVGVSVANISPGHFGTLGVQVLDGRDFSERDTAESELVAIVNETLAERFWPGETAVGKTFRLGSSPETPSRRVIAVVRTGKYRSLGENPRSFLYMPISQSYASQVTLVVRTDGDPLALAGAVRNEVRVLDSRLPVYDLKDLTGHLTFALWGPRMGAILSTIFAVIALLLAMVGLYGVMSFVVARQTREIGIRVALGAEPGRVLRMVLAKGFLLVGIGFAIGLAAALGAAQLLRNLLFGVSPADPLVFGGILAVLALSAFAATFVPARRALSVDPMTALRCE